MLMSRRVFLSVLGTSVYKTCSYFYGDFHSSKVSFIQQATLEYLRVLDKWDKTKDKVIIIMTDKARQKNWDKNITSRPDFSKNEVPYRGLEAVLDEMGLSPMVETVCIPSGENSEEIWEIFNRIYDALDNEDELYIDITHSFRYLPMLLMVLCNYSKFMKDVKVKNITYGNYEARDTSTDEAPIIDLLPISLLQDWTSAGADFIRNGRTKELSEISEETLRSIRKNQVDKQSDANKLGRSVKSLNDIVEDFQLTQGSKIQKWEYKLTDIAKDGEDCARLIPPLMPIMQKIESSLEAFKPGGRASNMISASRWCFDKHLYHQAITLLREGVISYVCECCGINLYDKDKREVISGYLAHVDDFMMGESETKGISCEEKKAVLKSILAKNLGREFFDKYSRLTDTRNYINHAGIRANFSGNKALHDAIESSLLYFENIVKNDPS